MKTAIVYYSRSGNTKYAAQMLKEKLKGKNIDVDLIEIQSVKRPGFFKAGRAAMREMDLPIKNIDVDLHSYDAFVVGSPIWAGKPAPFIKTFFSTAKNVKGKKTVMFVTGGGKPDSQGKAKDCIKQQLETVGVNATDAILVLQMKKGKIKDGEQQIDGFLKVVTSP